MQVEVRGIEANDIADWPHWSPAGASCELQWFTVTIGPPGEPGADLFQVAVATPLGLKDRRTKGKFVGLVVDRFDPPLVEQAIREFVARRKRDIQDNHYLNTHCSRHRAASPVSPASTSLRRPGAAELGR
jgi:hypothetical protein